jgi:hypothetical protein
MTGITRFGIRNNRTYRETARTPGVIDRGKLSAISSDISDNGKIITETQAHVTDLESKSDILDKRTNEVLLQVEQALLGVEKLMASYNSLKTEVEEMEAFMASSDLTISNLKSEMVKKVEGRLTEIEAPIDDKDAVNKIYVDAPITNIKSQVAGFEFETKNMLKDQDNENARIESRITGLSDTVTNMLAIGWTFVQPIHPFVQRFFGLQVGIMGQLLVIKGTIELPIQPQAPVKDGYWIAGDVSLAKNRVSIEGTCRAWVENIDPTLVSFRIDDRILSIQRHQAGGRKVVRFYFNSVHVYVPDF